MKATTQRKVTFGILGLAAIAFVVDRCTSSSTPPAAHAMAVTTRDSGHVPAHPAATGAGEMAPVNIEQVSARLEKVAADEGLDASHARDAFAPSNLWKPKGELKADLSERLASAGQFRQKHTLIGILASKKNGMIILDGKPVRLNQVVDGFRLAQIHDRDAIFEAGDARVQLTVVGPAAGATADNMEIRPARAGQSW